VTDAIVLLSLVVFPAIVLGIVAMQLRAKRRAIASWLERVKASLPGSEWFDDARFRWKGRVYLLVPGPNPVLSKQIVVRLSTFCPGLLEAEIRAARNVPTKTPQKLAGDDFFAAYVLDAPSPDEAAEWLLAVKPVIRGLFPHRWGAVTHLYGEIALSANPATIEDLAPDLDALAQLAAVRAERKPRGGTWTIREGFEPHPPAWHWKPEQRAALPAGARRWCISAWYDNSYLNIALARLLWTLAGDRPLSIVTVGTELDFLADGFGTPVPVVDQAVRIASPEMAVAADQALDGDFLGLAVAGEPGDAFAGALKLQLLDRALAAFPRFRFVARRLFDDEFSWFSGEYEIVSTELADEEVRAAFSTLAAEFGAKVVALERPFSFKLLKEDRLEVAL
jgi:hypothetical protein